MPETAPKSLLVHVVSAWLQEIPQDDPIHKVFAALLAKPLAAFEALTQGFVTDSRWNADWLNGCAAARELATLRSSYTNTVYSVRVESVAEDGYHGTLRLKDTLGIAVHLPVTLKRDVPIEGAPDKIKVVPGHI